MGVSFLPSFNQRAYLLCDSGICLSPVRQWYLHDQIGPFCPENDRNLFQQFQNQSAGKQPLILEMPSQPVTALQQSILGSVEPARKPGTTADPVLTKKYNP